MIFIMLVGSVLQTGVPAFSILGYAKAPVLLSIVLYYALTRGVAVTLVAALLAGFLHDVMSQIPLGRSVFCFCVAGWFAGYFRNIVLTDSIFTTIIFGAAANAVVTIFFYLVLLQDGLIQHSSLWIVLKLTGSLILGMVCTPLVFYLAGWLDRRVGNLDMEQTLDGVE